MSEESPKGGEFSLLNAIAGSYLSELAYRSKAIVIQTAEQGWKLNHVEYFEGPHTTRCFAAETEDYIIISFRGTASLHNLEHDLETALYPGPFNSQVHKGWALALNGVFTCLCDYVKESWGRKYRKIFVTGHSLGAALGNIFMAKWVNDSIGSIEDMMACYNFGSPKVGNSMWAQEFNKIFKQRTFRIVNHNDPVVLVPTLTVLLILFLTFLQSTNMWDVSANLTCRIN